MPRGIPTAGRHRDYRGHFVNGYGYREIHAPDHPMANTKGYVPQHRLVASIMAGRLLTPAEKVHHINHDKLDNRPANLEVLSQSEHMKRHPESIQRAFAAGDHSAAGKLGAAARWGKEISV